MIYSVYRAGSEQPCLAYSQLLLLLSSPVMDLTHLFVLAPLMTGSNHLLMPLAIYLQSPAFYISTNNYTDKHILL